MASSQTTPDLPVSLRTPPPQPGAANWVVRPLTLAVQLGLATSLLAGFGWAPAAHAQSDATVVTQADDARHYDISAGPLSAVLTRFSSEAGIFFVGASELAQGKTSPGVQGRMGVPAALHQLLAGTGLQAQRNEQGQYVLRELGEAIMLSPVMISGKAIGSTTEGTGSYTTGSTSSATRLNLSVKETPQSVTVMTRQRLDDQRLRDLADVFEATPGVSIQRTSGYEAGAPAVYARGTIINSFQIDGVPTSDSLRSYVQSTAIYDRVEIVRGATGLMNSLGTPAATINLLRKRPTYEPQIKLSAEAGNWDRYGSDVDVSGPLTESGNIRGRVVAEYKRQGNWTDNYQRDHYTLYGIGEIDLGDNILLTAGFSHTARDTDAPSGTSPMFYYDGQRVRFDPSDNGGPSWQYYDHEINNAFASLEHQFSSGWSGKAEVSHTKYDSTSLYYGAATQVIPGGGATMTAPWREKPNRKQTTFDAYVTGPFSLFGREHELIGGVTLSDLRSEVPSYSVSWSGSGSYYVPDYFDFTNTLPKPDQITETGASDTDETQYSAYMSMRFHLSDATSLLLGGRVTDWKRETDSITYATGSRTKQEMKETGLFVPYAGIVHDLNDTWSLYASYTKIFNPHPDRYRDINNSTLTPEEGVSYETGVKASFHEGRLNASLSLYKTELDNFAIWYQAGGRTVYDTADGTESQGVELELNGELAEGWQLGAGYSYNEIRDQNDDRLMASMPQHLVKVFSTYRLPGALNKITLGGGFDWLSKTENGGFSKGSYALASLMARYAISENLSVSTNINNLFDKEYLQHFNPVPAGGAGYGVYGPPRNVMFSVQYIY